MASNLVLISSRTPFHFFSSLSLSFGRSHSLVCVAVHHVSSVQCPVSSHWDTHLNQLLGISNNAKKEHHAQEACKSAGPNWGLFRSLLLLCILSWAFVNPSAPAAQRIRSCFQHGGEWNNHTSYFFIVLSTAGRWVSSLTLLLNSLVAWVSFSGRVELTALVSACTSIRYAQKLRWTLDVALAIWDYYCQAAAHRTFDQTISCWRH